MCDRPSATPRLQPHAGLLALLVTMLVVAGVAPAHSHAATLGMFVTRHAAGGTQIITSSGLGYRQVNEDRHGRRLDGEIIDFRSRRVYVIDYRTHRVQTLTLAAAVAQSRLEKRALSTASFPYLRPPHSALIGAAYRRTRSLRTIRGVRTRAYLAGEPGGEMRAWYPTRRVLISSAVRHLLGSASAGGSTLAGQIPLLIQERAAGKAWKTVSSAKHLRRGIVTRRSFARPRHLRGAHLLPGGAHAATTPAHLSRGSFTWFPVETHQQVFAVYWGHRFASEPATVAVLNGAIRADQSAPFVSGMHQYGIQGGRLLGSMVVPSDPPPSVGDTSLSGYRSLMPIIDAGRSAPGGQATWPRAGEAPLVVVFVDSDSVADDNDLSGYHSVIPTETATLDPLGLILYPVYPYALIKVPTRNPFGVGDFLDEAAVVLSHEIAEADTDPVAPSLGGWLDFRHPTGDQGEIADICHEGMHTPWSDHTRIGGNGRSFFAAAPYWSNAANACVPESRPTIHILTPPSGTLDPSRHEGAALGLRDGSVRRNREPVLLGRRVERRPPGRRPHDHAGPVGRRPRDHAHRHRLARRLQSSPDGGHRDLRRRPPCASRLRRRAPRSGPTRPSRSGPPPRTPPTGRSQAATWPGALTVCRGRPATRSPTRSRPRGTTRSPSWPPTTPCRPRAARSTSRADQPSGNPSVAITSPSDGANFPAGATTPVAFTAGSTDPADGTLSGGQLQWYDDYTDEHGVHHHVNFGSGSTASTTLDATGGSPVTHTITVIGTDTHGHIAEDAITVSSGVVS